MGKWLDKCNLSMNTTVPNEEDLTCDQYNTIWYVCISEAIIYVILLLIVIFNVYKYCYVERRYKIFTVSGFYFFAGVLITCRVT
jgi:uncharacterized integral membrane protein